MIRIDVKLDMKGLQKSLGDFQRRQLPFALAKTATGVAKRIAEAEREALPSIFDRPSLFTQRSIGVKAATKAASTATVFVKNTAASYLEPFEFGGRHLPQAKRTGKMLYPKAVPLNQYGNVPRTAVKRLQGRKDVFVGTVKTKEGQSINGVWQRPAAAGAKGRGLNRGESLKLLIRFGDPLPVQPRLGWFKRAQEVTNRTAGIEFAKAFKEALRTAK